MPTQSAGGTPNTSVAAFAASLGLLAVTVYLLVVGKDVFVPLVLGAFIAYLIVALSNVISRRKLGAWGPPGWLSLTLAVILFLLGITLLVELIAGNVEAVVEAAPQYQIRLEGLFAQASDVLTSTFRRKDPLTFNAVLDQLDLSSLAGGFAGALRAIAGNAFQIILYVVFLLFEYRTFDRKLAAMFPNPERQQALRATLAHMGRRIETYVLIKTLASLLTGTLSYFTLISLGVDFAGFWALLLFILNFIPYIGAVFGVLFPSLLAFLQFGDIATGLIVLGILSGIQAFVGSAVEPRLLGKSLNLSPLVIVVALSVWGAIWGITGMILSVPLMVITMIVLSQFPRTRPVAIFLSESGEVT